MASTDDITNNPMNEEELQPMDTEDNENAHNNQPTAGIKSEDTAENEPEQPLENDIAAESEEDEKLPSDGQPDDKSTTENMQHSSPEEPSLSIGKPEDTPHNIQEESITDDNAGNTSCNGVTMSDIPTIDCIKDTVKNTMSGASIKNSALESNESGLKKNKSPSSDSPTKPRRIISSQTTCSVVEAIKTKFENNSTNVPNFVIFVSKGNAGKEGPEDLFVPHHLYLDTAGIRTAGDVEELTKLCSDVTELHIATNFIESWNEVAIILQCLPKLSCLNLSSNPVVSNALVPSECSLDGVTFPNMTKLILNYCNIKWGTLSQLLQLFPHLLEMHLSFNDFHSVDLDAFDGRNCDSLSMLNINGNGFTSWEEISKLGQIFPKLKVLYMLDVPLSELPEGDDVATVMGQHFPELNQLCLKNCPINDWQCLEKFRHLPSLTHIKLLGKIPVLQDLDDKVRQQLILAYFPCLTHLNGGRLTETEKEDADRAFIRSFMDKENKPNRYHELEAQYGKLDPLAEVDFSARDDDSVQVLVSFDEEKAEMQRVELSWKLNDLYEKFRPLYKGEGIFSRSSHVMFVQNHNTPYTDGQMSLYERSMRGYNLEDGSIIQIMKRTGCKQWQKRPKKWKSAARKD